MMLIGFCTDSLKRTVCYYYTNSMFCCRVTQTVGPPSVLYKLKFGNSNFFGLVKKNFFSIMIRTASSNRLRKLNGLFGTGGKSPF